MRELQQKNAELTQALDRLNFSLAATGVGLWEMNCTQRTCHADERTYEIHGIDLQKVPAEKLVFGFIQSQIHPDDKGPTHEKIASITGAGKDFNLTYRVIHPDGQIHHVKVLGRRDNRASKDENIYCGFAWDATEEVMNELLLKEQKAKMLASTKMAALGEMSGGIAHEINNPLTVIQARAFQLNQMADTEKLDIAKVKQVADSISKTADKIAKIVRSLRSFSRDGAKDPFNIFSIQQVIEETLEFCKTKFCNNGVEVSVEPMPEDLEFECRLIQVQQVLLNLLNNSFDAVQDLEEKWIRLSVEEYEDSIDIHVMDSGTGIPNEIAQKMMNPFFTTKDVGKGTGLGLSISQDIIKAHQGELFYNSTSPHTKFTIRLPKFQQALP